MSDIEIIDGHVHLFQNAETGIRYQTAMAGGRGSPPRDGTIGEMKSFMSRLGVSKAVMLLYLPSVDMFDRRQPDLPRDPQERAEAVASLRKEIAGRIERYNQWGVDMARAHPEFLPFVGADPIFMGPRQLLNELEDKMAKGAKGVKLVPMALRLYLNDPRLWPVYDFCNRTGLPLLTQSGGGPGGESWDAWGRPIYLKYALEEFPKLKVITAHFGRGALDDVVELSRGYAGFYTDLSSQIGEWGEPGHWTVQEGVDAIRQTGVEKVIFGTNAPGSDPAKYVEKLKSLPMKEAEVEKIAAVNIKQVIGLD